MKTADKFIILSFVAIVGVTILVPHAIAMIETLNFAADMIGGITP